MYRPRVIPVLLLKNNGLVKSVKFKNHRYIGDPINAVKIFNDLNTDELIFLDIEASAKGQVVDAELVKNIGEEANMPFSIGGGIRSLHEIELLLKSGAERVIIGTSANTNPAFIKSAADEFGSSTIAVCIDVDKNWMNNYIVKYKNASKKSGYSLEEMLKLMEDNGSGEVIIQSVEQDGTRRGYDEKLCIRCSQAVDIPVSILGGANSMDDFLKIKKRTMINGFAAGSMFVYHGKRNAVLINYIDQKEKEKLFYNV